MATAERNTAKADNRQWFLRVGDETVFGPVSSRALVVWAEQGRVAPGNEVSQDRDKWIPAQELDILEMRWYVRDSTGNLSGPFNRVVVDALVRDKQLPEGVCLLSAEELNEAKPEAPPAKTAAVRTPNAAERLLELETSLETAQETLAKAEEERKRLEMQLEVNRRRGQNRRQTDTFVELHRQVETLQAQLEDAQRKLDETQTTYEERIAALQKAVDVKSPNTGAADDPTQSTTAVEQQNPDIERLGQECNDLRGTIARQQAVADALRREHAAEMERFEERVRSAEKQRDTALQERDDALSEIEINADLEARNEDLLAQTETLRSELEQMRTRLAESEAEPQPAPDDTQLVDAETYAGIVRECERLAENLDAERDSHAETLRFANSRDVTLRTEIDTLNRRLNESTARASTIATGMRADIADLIQSWIEEDQARIDTRRNALAKTVTASAPSRRDREIDDLKADSSKAQATWDSRERELQRRIRVLEAQDAAYRERIATLEQSGDSSKTLGDRLRQREQELAQAKKQSQSDRADGEKTRHALMLRIEELENAAGSLAGLSSLSAASTPSDTPTSSSREASPPRQARRGFQPTPWMRLK